MKLNPTQVKQSLKQMDAQVLPDDDRRWRN
jgi:hypothetical protein